MNEATSSLTRAGGQIAKLLWQTLAAAAQYLVPFICLVGAVISAIKQRQRRALVSTVGTQSEPLVQINKLGWAEFEILVGELFRQKGYQVVESGGGGADGGGRRNRWLGRDIGEVF